jgi:hypothetical protein
MTGFYKHGTKFGFIKAGHFLTRSYILLTAHLVMILGKWPTWRTILFLCIYSNSLHVSSNLVLIIRIINCINTAPGICHCVSVTVSCAGPDFLAIYFNNALIMFVVGLDSSVGIPTWFGLHIPGIECRRRRDYPHPSRPTLGPAESTWSFPGRGVDHSPSSSAEVKEKVDLYIYSPSGPSWPVLR